MMTTLLFSLADIDTAVFTPDFDTTRGIFCAVAWVSTAIAALITVINLAIDAIVTLMDPRLRTKVAK